MKVNKKVVSFATAATMLLGTASFAAVPTNSVVLGDEGYSVDLLFGTDYLAQINGSIADADGALYYNLGDGWKDIFTNAVLTDEQLGAWPQVSYTDAEGNTAIYAEGNGDVIAEGLAAAAASDIKVEDGTYYVEVTFNKALGADVTNPDVTTGILAPYGTEVDADGFPMHLHVNGVAGEANISGFDWDLTGATPVAKLWLKNATTLTDGDALQFVFNDAVVDADGVALANATIDIAAITNAPVAGELSVTAVAALADVPVANGTAFADVTLPTEVEVTLSDETTATVPVTFAEGTYDGTTAGTYALAGTLDLSGLAKTVDAAGFTATVNVVVAEAVTELAVESVSAINGMLTVKLSKAPASTPTIADFKAKVSVNGVAATDVTATDIEWNLATLTATLTVPTIAQGDADKSVVYSVGYRETAAKTAAAFTVAKAEKLQVTGVKVISGDVSKDAENATDVNINSAVEIEFSEVYLASTVDLNSVKVVNKTTKAQIPGNFVYDSVNKKATFYPSINLEESATYTVEVTDAVKSADGTKQLAGYSTEFTTGSTTTVGNLVVATPITTNGGSTTAGGNGVLNTGETVTVRFSDDVDASTLNTGTFKLFNITQNKYVANSTATIGYAAGTRVATFTAGSDQQLGDRFRVEVVGVKDLAGSEVASFVYEFVTGAAVAPTLQPLNVASPNVFPKVQSATINGTYFQGFKLVYTFTQAMNADTLNDQTVQIREQGTTAGVEATVSYDTASNTLTVVPKSDLKANKSYEVYFDVDTIKTASGLAMTSPNTAFTTGDYVAPAVASTVPVNYATGIVETDKIKVTFDEALTTGTVVGSATANFAAGASVVLVDAAGNGVNISGAGVISFEDSNKTVVVNTTALGLSQGMTYTLKFNGGQSSANMLVRDASAANPGGNGNALASEYALTFTTRNADTAAPTVEKVLKGSSYAAGTEITAGTKDINFRSGDNLYVVFNELLDNATAAMTADNAVNTADEGNVIVERRASGTTAWTQIAYGAGTATVTDDLQVRKTYVTIPNAALNGTPTDSWEFRVRVLPTAGGGVVQDTAGNDLSSSYQFQFIREGSSFIYTPEAAGVAISRDTISNASGVAAGSGSADDTFTTTGNLNVADGNIVAIEQNDGSFFFGTTDTASAGVFDSLTEDLPTAGGGTPNGGVVVDMTTNSTSFAKLESGISRTAPLAVRIDANAGSNVDVNTINAETVKLTKGGESVAADVTYRVVGTSAYVSVNPQGTLDASTKYDLTVEGVKDTFGNTITTSATSFETAAATLPALKIDSSTPADNASSVAVDSTTTVEFNTAVTSTIAKVANAPAVAGQVAVKTAAGVYLATTDFEATLSNGNKTLTITPNSFLAPNTNYVVEIHGDTTNSGGANNRIDAGNVVTVTTFKTEDPASKTPQIASARLIDINNNGLGDNGDQIIITLNTANNGTAVTVDGNVGGTGIAADHFTVSAGYSLGTGTTSGSAVTQQADGKTIVITLADGVGGTPTNVTLIPDVTTIRLTDADFSGNGTDDITANGVSFDTNTVTITK